MLKKIIIPTVVALAFASNAFALSGQGSFKKKSNKIKGAWVLVEVDGQQVIAFHKNFDTQNTGELQLVLSKQSIRKLDNSPTFEDPLSLGAIRSNTGDQNYVLPAHIDLQDYKSIVIHSAADNVLVGGFDIPKERRSFSSQSGFSSLSLIHI